MYHKIAKICQTIFIIFLCIYALTLIWCPNVYAETIKGKARVIDGDTIEINGEKIRLLCIDTPESNYRGKTQYCLDNETDCGDLAKKALKHLIGNEHEVWCEYEKRDMYGRILGMCQEYSYWNTYPYWGTYNYEMIYNGYAWFYPGGKECEEFKQTFENAKEKGRGLFNEELGGFKEPKAWRKKRSND